MDGVLGVCHTSKGSTYEGSETCNPMSGVCRTNRVNVAKATTT
jgi:hypothetical protein